MNLKVAIVLLLVLGGGAGAGIGTYRYLHAPPPGLQEATLQAKDERAQKSGPERRPAIQWAAAAPAPTPVATQKPMPTPSFTATPAPTPQAREADKQKPRKPAISGKVEENLSEENAVVPKSVAREALALVGADPGAEEVWATAINDPNLSSHTRSDLIEDLNEEGFPDPKNITMDDLPLITNRLAMIEQQAPYAMDDVNAAAFQEAYKDLVNMYNRLTGGM